MRSRVRVRNAGFLLMVLWVGACGAPGSVLAPMTEIMPGTYTGTDSGGALTWMITQSGQAVSGSGTFLAVGAQSSASYTLRGTFVDGALELRLLGAPGDTDADSVWFTGRAVPDLYAGAVFSGSLYGPTAGLTGTLSMYITETH